MNTVESHFVASKKNAALGLAALQMQGNCV